MVRYCLMVCAAIGFLAGCDRQPQRIGETGPGFDPITFFSGHTHSWGVIENRSGAPTEAIETDSQGRLDATGRLQMTQRLLYQDGKTQEQIWTMARTAPNRFQATANDMVGTADGRSDGRVFHWQWVLARSPGNPLMNVTMEQWMYQLADGTTLIRTTVSKLNVILAEVSEHFSHADGSSPNPA